jgi:hypothetical protein
MSTHDEQVRANAWIVPACFYDTFNVVLMRSHSRQVHTCTFTRNPRLVRQFIDDSFIHLPTHSWFFSPLPAPFPLEEAGRSYIRAP